MRCPNHHHVYQIENFLENKRRAKGTHTCTQEKTETVECRLSRLKYLKAQVTKPQIPSIRFSRTKYIQQICVMAFAGKFWCLCLQMNNFLSILMLFTHTHTILLLLLASYAVTSWSIKYLKWIFIFTKGWITTTVKEDKRNTASMSTHVWALLNI